MKKNQYDRVIKKSLIIVFVLIGVYTIIGCFFINHFIFGIRINGINISCMELSKAERYIDEESSKYKLQIQGRDHNIEFSLDDINFKYVTNNEINKILKNQNPFLWIKVFFDHKNYILKEIYSYDDKLLQEKINNLIFFKEDNIVYPKNASLLFVGDTYEIVDEVYGNYLNKEKFYDELLQSIYSGEKVLNLEQEHCYVNPKYYTDSKEVIAAKVLLDKYIGAKITYIFGNESEIVDYSLINQWIDIDEDMNISINDTKILNFLSKLANKYDTVGSTRKFETSTGNTVDVSGGYYGWKINKKKEEQILKEDIENGSIQEREPEYLQKALSREENDIGTSYVEINLTRQYLWYYKDGKLITEGDFVSGNKSNGNSTPLGIYEITYKQKNATLNGANYSSKVTYWMPFNGNIGMHDASWRSSFGGNIYLSDGSHGCVNMPKYLAEKIFNEIETGTPVICYEDKS